MPINLYRTKSIKQTAVPSQWVVYDVAGQIVGRVASNIARRLKGKDQAFYTPHVDCGIHVVVINASQVVFTGNKEKKKRYIRYTGYPGGQRETTPEKLRAKHPIRLLEKAIKGMLHNNRLNRSILRNKLHIYPGATHPHTAQIKAS